MKEIVGKELAKRVKDGSVIGLGSGTTAIAAIEAIGERIKTEGIRVAGIPTSVATAHAAEEAGINVLSAMTKTRLSWGFDGADEVDPERNLIKGAGGAFFNEKIIAKRCDKFVILVTPDKMVKKLGENFAVPVEVVPEAVEIAKAALLELGAASVVLRTVTNPYQKVVQRITDHGNLILDAKFNIVTRALERDINAITGVLENGLFFDCTDEILLVKENGVFSITDAGEKQLA